MSKVYKVTTSNFFSKKGWVIKFDENQLSIESVLSNDEKSSQIIEIKNIVKFSDFNFGEDLTFKIKEKNGNKFSIYAKKGKSTQDLEFLINDFKEMLEGTEERQDSPIYKNFYQGKYAVLALIVLGLIALFMTILFVIKIINDVGSMNYTNIFLSVVKIFVIDIFYVMYFVNHKEKRNRIF